MNNSILAQVSALPKMGAAELKKMWKEMYRTDPPPFNKPYYVKRLAYRIQEVTFGIDSSRIDKRLSALSARELDKPAKERKRTAVHRPATGTRLIREYNGHEHYVAVLDDGFEYKGQRYASLSAIARKITGTRWNGLVFFGIKRMRSYRHV